MNRSTTGHKHAALMAEFARDAAVMERPWEAWEICEDGVWRDCYHMMCWNESQEYRRKPRTIRIGEIDVPEPVRVALEKGESYYVADPTQDTFIIDDLYWNDDDSDIRWLARGLIHLTQKAAEAHGRALAALTEAKD